MSLFFLFSGINVSISKVYLRPKVSREVFVSVSYYDGFSRPQGVPGGEGYPCRDLPLRTTENGEGGGVPSRG